MLPITIYNVAHQQLSFALMENDAIPSAVADNAAWWIMDNFPDAPFNPDFLNHIITYTPDLLLSLYNNVLPFDFPNKVYFMDISNAEKIRIALDFIKSNYQWTYTIVNDNEYWTFYAKD